MYWNINNEKKIKEIKDKKGKLKDSQKIIFKYSKFDKKIYK